MAYQQSQVALWQCSDWELQLPESLFAPLETSWTPPAEQQPRWVQKLCAHDQPYLRAGGTDFSCYVDTMLYILPGWSLASSSAEGLCMAATCLMPAD